MILRRMGNLISRLLEDDAPASAAPRRVSDPEPLIVIAVPRVRILGPKPIGQKERDAFDARVAFHGRGAGIAGKPVFDGSPSDCTVGRQLLGYQATRRDLSAAAIDRAAFETVTVMARASRRFSVNSRSIDEADPSSNIGRDTAAQIDAAKRRLAQG